MNAYRLFHTLVHIVILRSFRKIDFYGEGSSRDSVDLGSTEKVRELIGIHSG
jgi:hypothetical protein